MTRPRRQIAQVVRLHRVDVLHVVAELIGEEQRDACTVASSDATITLADTPVLPIPAQDFWNPAVLGPRVTGPIDFGRKET